MKVTVGSNRQTWSEKVSRLRFPEPACLIWGRRWWMIKLYKVIITILKMPSTVGVGVQLAEHVPHIHGALGLSPGSPTPCKLGKSACTYNSSTWERQEDRMLMVKLNSYKSHWEPAWSHQTLSLSKKQAWWENPAKRWAGTGSTSEHGCKLNLIILSRAI